MWGRGIKICTQILHRGYSHVTLRMHSDDLHWSGILDKATGNSRSESQKFPPAPLSVKIPENSRYENIAYTPRM